MSEQRIQDLKSALDAEQREEQERHREATERKGRRARIAEGVALDDLEPIEERISVGRRIELTLARQVAPIPRNFDPGSVVQLASKRQEDTEETARATIAKRRGHRLTLSFDRAPPDFVRDGQSFIEILPNSVTFDRARASLRAVDALESGSGRRKRDAWFGHDSPRFAKPSPAPENPHLNAEQRAATARAMAAEDFFLLHGPPGTGKSTVLGEVMVQAVARGERVLATASSNSAVDHLLELTLDRGLSALRVGHPARVSEALQEHTLDARVDADPQAAVLRELLEEAFALLGYARRQHIQGRSRARHAQARDAKREARELFDRARSLERALYRAHLEDAQVVCSTLSGLSGRVLDQEHFEVAVIDEATQAIEPLVLSAWLRSDRIVLAGDPCQLAATVMSPAASALGISALERLMESHPNAIHMLEVQYRMNRAIMSFPSKSHYGGRLRAGNANAEWQLEHSSSLDLAPFLFVDTAGKGFDEARDQNSDSWTNPGEAELLLTYARALLCEGLTPGQLALIVPYSAQAALLREAGLPDEVEIDTVDAFQGREKDAILVGAVRSNAIGNLGFLADTRRFNVALTRARKHLVVVGDSAALCANDYFSALLSHAEESGAYRSAWTWPND